MLSSENPEPHIKPEVLTDREIFTRIWTEPRVVFRFLEDFRYDRYTYVLLFLAAVVNSLDHAGKNNMGEEHSLMYVLIMTIIFGGTFGAMFYYIYAAIASWVGRWFGGKANTASLLRVFAHAAFPVVLTLVIVIIHIALFGIDLFRGEIVIDDYDTTYNVIYWITIVVQISLAIWGICLAVVGVSEVQKISIGAAIGNVFLPVVMIVAVFALIVMPFVLW